MARNKSAAPEQTVTDAAEEVVVIESAIENGTGEAPPEMVHESASAEAESLIQGNLVVESVRSGAAAAQEAVTRFVPAVGDGLRKVAYQGIYGVSFGVTFGALLVARLVPKESFVGHALADGAAAAKVAIHELDEKPVAAGDEHDAPMSPAAA